MVGETKLTLVARLFLRQVVVMNVKVSSNIVENGMTRIDMGSLLEGHDGQEQRAVERLSIMRRLCISPKLLLVLSI